MSAEDWEEVTPSALHSDWEEVADDAAPPVAAAAPPASAIDTITALPRGAYQGVVRGLPEMVGKATQFAGSYLPDAVSEPVQRVGKAVSETSLVQGRLTPAELEQEQTEAQSRQGAEKMLFSAGEMLGPSLIPGGAATGAARGALGVAKIGKMARAAAKAGDVAETVALGAKATARAKKALNIGAGAAAGLFGASQAQNTRDTALERASQLEAEGDVVGAEKMRDRAFGVAPFVTGGIEAAGEFFGTKYLGKLLGADVAEKLIERGIKPGIIKSFLRTAGVEVGTELGQQGTQAAVEKYSDIRPDANILEEMKSVIGPTVILTALTGIGGNAAQSIAQRGGNAKIRKVLLSDAQTLGINDAQTLPNDQLEEQVWRGYAEKYDIPDRDTATVEDLRKLVPEFAVTRAREAIEARKVRVSEGLEALDLTAAPAAQAPGADQAAFSRGLDVGAAGPAAPRPVKTKADEGLWSVPSAPAVTTDPAVVEGRRPLDLAGVSRAPAVAQQPNQPPATAPEAAAPAGRANGEVSMTPQADLLGAEDPAQQLDTLTPGAESASVQGDEDAGPKEYISEAGVLGAGGQPGAPQAQGGAQATRDNAAPERVVARPGDTLFARYSEGVPGAGAPRDAGARAVDRVLSPDARRAEQEIRRVVAGHDQSWDIDRVRVVPTPTTEQGRIAEALNKITKRKVTYVTGVPFEGVTLSGSRIFLGDKSTRPLLSLFGHELAHTGSKPAEARYLGVLKDVVGREEFLRYAAKIRGAQGAENVEYLQDEDGVWEEFGADFLGEQLTKAKFWEDLAKRDRGVFIRVARWVSQKLKVLGIETYEMDKYLADPAKMARAVQAAQTYFESLAAPATQDAAAGPEFALATDEQLVIDLKAQEQSLAPGAQRQMVAQQRVEAEARVRNAKLREPAVNEFGGSEARFALVPPVLAKRLEAGEKIKVYRAMQTIDGKLYPPMSAKVNGELRQPTEIGAWEKAVEDPAMANGKFRLDKGNKATMDVAYNPYFHTSRTPLNDQFSSAYKRPNLVTVEVEVPASELTSGYRATGAKDAVGEMSWHAGPVSSKLPADRKRKVILSRYAKVVRVVPDSEVAGVVAGMLDGVDVVIPGNTVTPSLRAELLAQGVAVSDAPGPRFALTDRPREAKLQDIRAKLDSLVETADPRKAGFILPDGRMMIKRGDEHRMTFGDGAAASADDLAMAMTDGAIRVDHQFGMLNLASAPTSKAIASIQGFVDAQRYGTQIEMVDGDKKDYQQYPPRVRAETVTRDIQVFYGQAPAVKYRSPMAEFRGGQDDDSQFALADVGVGFNPTQPTWFEAKFQRKYQDQYVDLAVFSKELQEFLGQELPEDRNPWLRSQLYRARTSEAIKHFNDKQVNPLIARLQNHHITTDEMDKFLIMRRAADYNAHVKLINPDMQGKLESGRDSGSGFHQTQIDAYFKSLTPVKRKVYDSLAAEIDAWRSQMQKILVDSGLETQDTINIWNSTDPNYVPFTREKYALEMHNSTGKGTNVRGDFSRRVIGSNEKIFSPLAAMGLAMHRAITLAEKNRVSQSAWAMAVENPNEDVYTPIDFNKNDSVDVKQTWAALEAAELRANQTQDEADVEKVKTLKAKYTRLRKAQATSAPKILAALRSLGLSQEDAVNVYAEPQVRRINPRTGMVEITRNPFIQNAPNVLNLRINGEDKMLMFNDENVRGMEVLKALKNEDVGSIDGFLSTAAKATRWIAKANTQWNPLFGIRNFMRDFSTAMLNLSSTPLAGEQAKIGKYAASAVKHLWVDARAERDGKPLPDSKLKGLLTEAREDGVPTAYRDMFDNAKQYQESLVKAFKFDANQGVGVRARNIAKGFAGVLEDYNAVTEMAFRFATYRAARESNIGGDGINGPNTRAKAALLAKDITVNFDRKGQNSSQLGALYAFFNASMQGTARLKRTMVGENGLPSKTGMQIAAGGVLLGVLQGVMLRAMGVGDDDEPRQYEREKNLLIPNPFKAGDWIKVPMPLGFNVLPNIGRIAFETSMSGEPTKRMIDLLGSVADTFNPMGSENNPVQMISPTVMDPFTNLLANQDWNGRPIYRESFNKRRPDSGPNRSREDATAPAQMLVTALDRLTGGEEGVPGKLSFTADAVDYLAGYVGGGAYREASKLAQYVANKATGGEGLPAYKTPGVGGFHTDTTDLRGAASTYFSNTERVYKAMTALDYRKENRLGTKGFFEKYPEGGLIGVLKDTERQLRGFKQTKDVLMLRKTRIEKANQPDRAQQLEVVKDRLKRIETRKLEAMQRFNVRVKAAAQKAREAKDRSMAIGR